VVFPKGDLNMLKILYQIKRIWSLLYCCFRKNKIVITRSVLSGNGSFIDVRYWLSRPDRINPQTKIYLVHPETGTRLGVMNLAKIGPVKTKHTELAETGVVLFRNSNKLITSGSQVSIILGKLKVDNIEII
jgi:hypothetical protein